VEKSNSNTTITNPLNQEAYIKQCRQYAAEYETNVLCNSVLTNEFIKLAVQRGVDDKQRTDLYFDAEAVDQVYKFFSFLHIPVNNRIRQFKLEPWQCWVIREIFGYFYTDDNSRRFIFAMLFMARKNGKTVFAEAVSLYMFIYDNELSPEIYYAAAGPEQTNLLMKYVKGIISNSPALRKRVKVFRYFLSNKVYGDATLKAVINKAEKLDALNPHFALVDEYHAHKDDSLFNIFTTGMVNRGNPLIMITSTAGVNKDGPLFKEIEIAKTVLRREATNDRFFYALYSLDSDDEIEIPEAWVKANPNIGVTITLKKLIGYKEAAKLSPTKWHDFIIKNLNVFQDQLIDQWISDSEYKKCFLDSEFEKLANYVNPKTGQREKLNAYCGIDLASTRDLASMVTIVEHPITGKIHVFPEFYFPNNPQKMLRGTEIDLREWIKKGHIYEMETPTIDQDFIIERVAKLNEVFKIVKIGYDQFNAGFMITKIKRMGIPADPCPQTALFFNLPLKSIERWMLNDNMVMSTNPVLRWMFTNIVLYVDGNGNIKIMKNKSKDSVDGPVALGMAAGIYLSMAKNAHLFEIYSTKSA